MLAIDGLGLGGAEMVVRDLARGLDAKSFDVSICCTKGLGGSVGETLLRDGYDVFVLPGQTDHKVDYLTALKFRRAIVDRKIDVVHTHATPALLDAAPCRVADRRLRVVHTFHFGNYPYDHWRHHLLELICARGVDRLVAVGWDQQRRISTAYHLPSSRVAVIWNGITVGNAAADTSFRTAIGTGERLLVGTVAKLIEQKGLDDLLAVAKRCRDADYDMQFVVVGDGPLRTALEKRRKELALEDTVVFAGWIPNAASTVLPTFDVFFQPSRWEAMSIVILEAMASRRAIVATKVGDNERVLEDAKSGLLVDPGHVDGMFYALTRLRDDNLRERLGREARLKYEQSFTTDKMVRRYEEVYRSLVGQ